MKRITLLFLLSSITTCLFAQSEESLDLEKAIQLGLENNLQVKIAIETITLR